MISYSQGLFAAVIAALSLLSACGPAKRYGDSELRSRLDEETTLSELAHLRQTFHLSSRLNVEEEGALAYDFWRMRRMRFKADAARNETLEAAYSTLFEVEPRSEGPGKLEAFIGTRVRQFNSTASDPNANPMVVASNLSIPYWIQALTQAENPLAPPTYKIEELAVRPTDSRAIGIVHLGAQYGEKDDAIFRIGTLLHEARHSDCPSGIPEKTARSFNGKSLDSIFEKEGDALANCGFRHSLCADGPLAGKPACESGSGWGAYALEVAFYGRLVKACDDCTEEEYQQALTGYLEISGRITDLEALLDGKLGAPDMRHAGVVP